MPCTPDPLSPNNENSDDRERQLFLEAIAGREFTMTDIISQAGGDFLKGESPIPKLVQLKIELNLFISQELRDVSGALQAVLQQYVDEADEQISRHFKDPLLVLKELVEKILRDSVSLYELVHQVDFKWGQMNQERPYFQKPGDKPHPDDEYSHESVKVQLTHFLDRIRANLETKAVE